MEYSNAPFTVFKVDKLREARQLSTQNRIFPPSYLSGLLGGLLASYIGFKANPALLELGHNVYVP